MGSLRVLILPFSSFCYACGKVKEAEMAAPCIASVNGNGDPRKNAFKLPSKMYQVHLFALGLSKTMSFFLRRNIAIFLQAVIICTIT